MLVLPLVVVFGETEEGEVTCQSNSCHELEELGFVLSPDIRAPNYQLMVCTAVCYISKILQVVNVGGWV